MRSIAGSNLLSATVLAICLVCLALAIGESSGFLSRLPSEFFVPVGWVLFAFFVVLIHRGDYRFLPSAFYSVYYWVAILIGATLISYGARMFEVGGVGTANGVFWTALLFAVVGLYAQFAGFRLSLRHDEKLRDVFAWGRSSYFPIAFLVVTVLASLWIMLVYGTPGGAGTNRVLYWGAVAPSYLSPIRIAITVSVFVAAYLAFESRNLVVFGVFAALYAGLGFWFLGEKFSLFVQYVFFVGLVAAVKVPPKKFVTLYGAVAIVLSVLFIGVAINYSAAGAGGWFVFERMALQGQLLWSVLNEPGQLLAFGIWDECGSMCAKLFDPRDMISERYTVPALYEARKTSGTTLSGYAPAVHILYFGAAGALIMQILSGFLLGFAQGHVVKAIKSGLLLYAFMLAVLYYFATSLWYVTNHNLIAPVALMAAACVVYRFLFVRVGGRETQTDSRASPVTG